VPGPDGSAPGGLAVSATVEPSNGHVDVSARGPQSATYFYWDTGGSWNGPLALGGVGSADSAPSIGVESNGTVDVVVQGPNHALYFYWQIAGSWYGPYSIAGNDVAYSTPSLAPDGAGHVYVAVKGPANRLDVWLDSGGAWTGPTTLGDADTTFSAPSVVEESPSTVLIGAVGLQNQETIYRNVSGVWQAPTSSAAGTAYSPSLGDIAFMGPSNALEAYQPSGPSYATVAGAGSSYSAPSGDAAATYLAVEGAGHALDYFALSGGSYHAQRLDTSVAYSAPSLTFEPNGHQDLALQGPSNTLYVYWLIGSTWYGPLAIGGAGTTYSSGS